jgi:hypothetical protein
MITFEFSGSAHLCMRNLTLSPFAAILNLE